MWNLAILLIFHNCYFNLKRKWQKGDNSPKNLKIKNKNLRNAVSKLEDRVWTVISTYKLFSFANILNLQKTTQAIDHLFFFLMFWNQVNSKQVLTFNSRLYRLFLFFLLIDYRKMLKVQRWSYRFRFFVSCNDSEICLVYTVYPDFFVVSLFRDFHSWPSVCEK